MCSDKLEWTSHPWAEDALARKVSMVALTAAASLIAADSFDSAWIGLVSAAALAGSMSRYLAPSRYELTDEGIRIAHLGMSRFHPWSRFRRVVRRVLGRARLERRDANVIHRVCGQIRKFARRAD